MKHTRRLHHVERLSGVEVGLDVVEELGLIERRVNDLDLVVDARRERQPLEIVPIVL